MLIEVRARCQAREVVEGWSCMRAGEKVRLYRFADGAHLHLCTQHASMTRTRVGLALERVEGRN